MKKIFSMFLVLLISVSCVVTPVLAVETETDTETEETELTELTPLDEVVVGDYTLDLSDFASVKSSYVILVSKSDSKIYLYIGYNCPIVRRQTPNVSAAGYPNFQCVSISNTAQNFQVHLYNTTSDSFSLMSPVSYFSVNNYDIIYSNVDILEFDKATVYFSKNLESFEFNISSDTDIDTETNTNTQIITQTDNEIKGLLYYITGFLFFFTIIVILYFIYKFFNIFFKF